MSRDLAGDVERLMKSGNSYIKKKVYILHFVYECDYLLDQNRSAASKLAIVP